MSETITFTIDGKKIPARKGQTIIEAAEEAGVYIPRLCWMKDLIPGGACRVCTVMVNGRPQAACTQPAAEDIVVQNETAELQQWRKNIIEMLFVEGNHYCMFCEKSGNCELQAMAYRFGITAPKYPYQFPQRAVDASHPDVIIDHNRCILCGRCGRTARVKDGKPIFGAVNRGIRSQLAVGPEKLGETELRVTDKATEVCPVGALMKKRVGYAVPVGKRLYDNEPIGSDIEKAGKSA
ncbi:MAG: 2Fe-2S iron-sulfur cluster-binding protein [Myxococcales bacterium]|jgi:[NiFe] hydrogenase diaphorase moiety small subunit